MLKPIVTALMAVAMVAASSTMASAGLVSAPGCDGQSHMVPTANTPAQCMANGPKLRCPYAQTKAYCDRKFAGK